METIPAGPETAVVAVHGDADLHTAPRLKVELGAQIDRGMAHIVVDLSEATFVDSMTLGVLLGALKRLRPAGGRMSVVCGDPHIRKIFELTLLDQVFQVTASRDEALSPA